MCFRNASAFFKVFNKGDHKSSSSSSSSSSLFSLPCSVAKAVHLCVNFQSKFDGTLYSECLVPAAAELAGVPPGSADAEGAALELIGLSAITTAMSVLDMGLGDDRSASLLKIRTTSQPPVHALRATVSAKKLSRVKSCGFAPYVDGISNMKESAKLAEPARKVVDSLCALVGREAAYRGDTPFKSLSLSLGDYAHAHELFDSLCKCFAFTW